MKKILLIGQDGMLGSELAEVLNKEYEITGTTMQTLDICDRDAVFRKVEEVKPYFIINCAAYTNVDGCETNYELANAVNGLALKNIADAAKQEGATLVHISTDYVFDGDLDVEKSYTEDMQPNPVSAYGKTKLVGENFVKTADKYYILRTAWLYGKGGKNFVKTMLTLSQTKDSLNVVCDQHGSPTSTTTLCSIIKQILEKEPEYGIYHSTNEGFTTWYEFAKKIFELANKKVNVNPVPSSEYPTPTKRPFNSQLSKEKLHSVGIYPENFEDALKKYIEEEF